MSTIIYARGCSANAVADVPPEEHSVEWIQVSDALATFMPYDASRYSPTAVSYGDTGTGGDPSINLQFTGSVMTRLLIESYAIPYTWDSGEIAINLNIDQVGVESPYTIPVTGSDGTSNNFNVVMSLLSSTSINPVRYKPAVKSLTLGKMPRGLNEFMSYAQGWVDTTGTAGQGIADALTNLKALAGKANSPRTRTKTSVVEVQQQRLVVEAEIKQVAEVQKPKKPIGKDPKIPVAKIGGIKQTENDMIFGVTGKPKGQGEKWIEVQVAELPDETAERVSWTFTRAPVAIVQGQPNVWDWNPFYMRARWMVQRNGRVYNGGWSPWVCLSRVVPTGEY